MIEMPVAMRAPMIVVGVKRETQYGNDEPKVDKRTGKKVWRATVLVLGKETTEQMIVHITDDADWSNLAMARVSGMKNGRVLLYGPGNKSATIHADGFLRQAKAGEHDGD